MRLIDADAIHYTMLYKENWLKGTGEEKQGVWKSDIDNMPTIEPMPKKTADEVIIHYENDMVAMTYNEYQDLLEEIRPIRHGRWTVGGDFDHNCECSECGCAGDDWNNYCPNCGAKMDKE